MDTLCGFQFKLSVPSFYQVNRDQAEVLYGKVLEYAALTGEETVLDLYCGTGTITRAEFAAMAVRFFDVEYDGPDLFSDTTGHWASDLINKAASAGIILGFKDGTFRPDQDITRAEAIAIFNRVLGRAPDKDHLLPEMITWPDNMDTDAWYYANMQEATNSHDYDRVKAADGTEYEVWTKILPVRDWAAFETEWATAGSAKNPGDVYSSQP